MILELAYYGNPILRKKAAPITEITPEIRQLVSDMVETMRSLKGIGIAAPQVQKSLAMFVTEVPKYVDEKDEEEWEDGELLLFINPKILSYSSEQGLREEGCLSIPGIRSEVLRPKKISVQATDIDGKIFEMELSGLHARAFMHENDHINGVLFVDRIHGKERKALDLKLRKLK